MTDRVRTRLAIVVSHPVQHFAPFYRALATHPDIQLTVLFGSRMGVDPYFDKKMNTVIAWRMDLLGGYDHAFVAASANVTDAGSPLSRRKIVSTTLSRLSPDVVLINGYEHWEELSALLWCRAHGVPAMMLADSELGAPRPALTRSLKRAVLPAWFKLYKCFLTVGDRNEEYYRHYYVHDSKLFRSPMTIDETTYMWARENRLALRAEARRKFDLGEDALVALTVGKVSDTKRVQDLVSIARLAKQREPARKFVFVLAGDGPRMTSLRDTVAAEHLSVKLVGFVNVDELPALYAAADVLIHPSALDAHPLAIAEAACVGLPLIVSDRVGAVGPRDIARPEENAIVYPCGDVDALFASLMRIVTDHQLASAMSDNSKRIFGQLNMQASVDGVLRAMTYCRSVGRAQHDAHA